MVRIPTPPERDCGQLSYAGLGCSYVGAGVLGIVHAQDMYDHSIDDLSLVICLGVEGNGFGELGIQQ